MTVTDRFKWGPRDADCLTLRELIDWADMAVELNDQDARAFGGKTND